jgi:hypothetical protein
MTQEELIKTALDELDQYQVRRYAQHLYNVRNALYKALEAPREWVGLTDEDMGFLFPHGKSAWVQETVKIIEAKLKEKNNPLK